MEWQLSCAHLFQRRSWKELYSVADTLLTIEGKASGSAEPLTVGRGRDTQAAASRDGRQIAFSALDVSFNLEAAAVRCRDRQNSGRSVTDHVRQRTSFIFITHLQMVARQVFDSHRGATSYIWRVDHGSPAVQLTSNPNYEDTYPRWSTDGRFISFNRKHTNDVQASEDIWLMAADGANPQKLIENACCAVWMPKRFCNHLPVIN